MRQIQRQCNHETLPEAIAIALHNKPRYAFDVFEISAKIYQLFKSHLRENSLDIHSTYPIRIRGHSTANLSPEKKQQIGKSSLPHSCDVN